MTASVDIGPGRHLLAVCQAGDLLRQDRGRWQLRRRVVWWRLCRVWRRARDADCHRPGGARRTSTSSSPRAGASWAPSPTAAHLGVYDVTGRLMTSSAGSPAYSIGDLPTGTYYVRTATSQSECLVDVDLSECSLHVEQLSGPGRARPSSSSPARRQSASIWRWSPSGSIRGRAILRGAVVDANGAPVSFDGRGFRHERPARWAIQPVSTWDL